MCSRYLEFNILLFFVVPKSKIYTHLNKIYILITFQEQVNNTKLAYVLDVLLVTVKFKYTICKNQACSMLYEVNIVFIRTTTPNVTERLHIFTGY